MARFVEMLDVMLFIDRPQHRGGHGTRMIVYKTPQSNLHSQQLTLGGLRRREIVYKNQFDAVKTV